MIIEIVNRIIKIPPTCKLIMQGEQQEENMIKIPKKILTDNIEKTKVFILTQLNDKEIKEEELELVENNNDYDNNYYRWDLKEEHTAEKGELKIQIKIKRGTFTEEPIPPTEEPENPEKPIDPEEPDLPKEDENEDNKEEPNPSENEEIMLLEENGEENNEEEDEGNNNEDPKDEEFDPNTPNLDPDFLIPYGDNTNGIWYSYKNSFYIEESLMETVDLNGG